MSAGSVLSLVGNVVGSYFFGPVGGAIGGFFGGTLGRAIDGNSSGPSLQDLKPQSSEYGRPIPIIYSVMAVAGNVISAADLAQGDAAGGKGTPDATSSQPTYTASFALLICEGPNKQLGRIWAGPDKRLVYDPNTQKLESGTIRFYEGSEDQMPDPFLESMFGAGNVPAYRGYCYLVIEGFDVTSHDGNRIPFLTVEIGNKGSSDVNTAPDNLGTTFTRQVIDIGASFLTVYDGTYRGILKTRKSDMVTIENRLIDLLDFSASDVFAYEPIQDVVMHVHRGQTITQLAGLTYSLIAMPTGDVTTHHPVVLPAGETLIAAGIVAGKYVFACNTSGGSYKFYFVDPNAPDVILNTQTFDAGQTDALVDIYRIDDVQHTIYGVTSTQVRRFDLDEGAPSGTSSVLGAPASTTGGVSSAVDPTTGYLWSLLNTGGNLTWSVIDATAGVVASGTQPSTFAQTALVPWLFVPTDTGSQVFIAGNRWLSVVHWTYFGGDGTYGGSFDSLATSGTHPPLYVGTALPDAAIYNSAMGKTVIIQENLWYGLTTAATPLGPEPWADSLVGYLGKVGVSGAASLGYMTLAEVVTDLSIRAGLTADEIDVTQLTDRVDGYTIANQVDVKSAIATLMPAYYFDAAEDQGKIRFIKRGGAIAAEIDDAELGAHPSDVLEPQDLVTTVRAMDEELPGTFNVNYVLAATNYSPATKYQRKLTGNSQSEQTLELPMVLTDQKAQEIASINLHDAWIGRITYGANLPRKYAYLMPTDIVGIQGYTMRLTKMTQDAGGFFACEAVRDDSDTYTPHVIVTETPTDLQTVASPSLSLLELM
jgi:hypothetical protein